jgi:hypothetical protein
MSPKPIYRPIWCSSSTVVNWLISYRASHSNNSTGGVRPLEGGNVVQIVPVDCRRILSHHLAIADQFSRDYTIPPLFYQPSTSYINSLNPLASRPRMQVNMEVLCNSRSPLRLPFHVMILDPVYNCLCTNGPANCIRHRARPRYDPGQTNMNQVCFTVYSVHFNSPSSRHSSLATPEFLLNSTLETRTGNMDPSSRAPRA